MKIKPNLLEWLLDIDPHIINGLNLTGLALTTFGFLAIINKFKPSLITNIIFVVVILLLLFLALTQVILAIYKRNKQKIIK